MTPEGGVIVAVMRAELPGRRVRELGLRETEAEFAERGTGPVAAKIVPCTEKIV